MGNKKIVLIIPYFAPKTPKYFDLFLKSLSYNKSINVYFFSNISINKFPENFSVFNLSFDELKKLVEKKLKTEVALDSPYKLCDLKPMYGHIFEDYLIDTEYWGFSDIDLIYGDLKKILFDDVNIFNYDIISFREEWLSGSFALFKNTQKVNTFYRRSNNWEKILKYPTYKGFDEMSKPLDKSNSIFSMVLKGIDLSKIPTEFDSMTHLLKLKEHDLNISFQTIIKESIPSGMILKYDNGKIKIHLSNDSNFQLEQEFLHYHFVKEKHTYLFDFPKWKNIPNRFYISKFGFHKNLNFIKISFLYRFIMRTLKKVIQKSFKIN